MATIRFSNFFKSVKISADDSAVALLGSGRPVRECLPAEQIAVVEAAFSSRNRPCNWDNLVALEGDSFIVISPTLKLN